MINFIKNIFYKKKENLNQIIFSIDENNTCWIDIKFDSDIISEKSFAELLFNLHSGNYKTSTIDTLVSLAENNPKIKGDIDNILIYWGLFMSSNKESIDKENQPFISPKNVFLGKDK